MVIGWGWGWAESEQSFPARVCVVKLIGEPVLSGAPPIASKPAEIKGAGAKANAPPGRNPSALVELTLLVSSCLPYIILAMASCKMKGKHHVVATVTLLLVQYDNVSDS